MGDVVIKLLGPTWQRRRMGGPLTGFATKRCLRSGQHIAGSTLQATVAISPVSQGQHGAHDLHERAAGMGLGLKHERLS